MRISSTKPTNAALGDPAGEAGELAQRIMADVKSGAFRGIAVAYVSAHGPEIHASNAIWFDQTDRMAALALASQLFELVQPGLNAAPGAAPSRAN